MAFPRFLFSNKRVSTSTDQNLDDLVEKIHASDLLISDLDGTVADPAKAIAYSYLVRMDKLLSPSFWKWSVPCAIDLALNGQGAEERQWSQFKSLFLHGSELQYQTDWYNANAKKTAYPGAERFYTLLTDTKKAFISRNLTSIVSSYKDAFGFDLAISEHYEPSESVPEVLSRFPDRRRVIFAGDAIYDGQTINELQRQQNIGRIDSLVTICVSNRRYHDTSSPFDLSINQNYEGLADLLLHYGQRRSAIPTRLAVENTLP